MSALSAKTLRDTLNRLGGWAGDTHEIHRQLVIDDAQHADLTERIKVAADSMGLRPTVRREQGNTEIWLRSSNNDGLTGYEVALAARIEDAYRAVASPDE